MSTATKWLADQWSKSNIISGIIAIGVWGAIIALAFQGRDIPAILATAGGAIIVFFYRAKGQQ